MIKKSNNTINSNFTKTFLALCFAATTFGFSTSAGIAGPTTLNIVPTADILKSNVLRVSYEADGHDQPYCDDYTAYTFTEYGVGDKAELGIDFYDINGSNKSRLNGKYLLFGEKDNHPAVAVGAMNIGDNCKTRFYMVGTKSVNKYRFHLGADTSGNEDAMMMGMEYSLNNTLTLMADYKSGIGNYHTLGLWWQASPTIGINPYFARNNTDDLRSTADYWGLYVGYKMKL